MNLVKAADDLKNLSDQQLMSAGQNPVAVPPYLVLAEMKRREQLRAEYAKAQQGQQQQQPVIQQVAQNLVQGQPQQPQQQQPQAQGIMQAMPQGAVGMAGGGHVARYADGDLVTTAEGFRERYKGATRAPQEISSTVEQMFGAPDYSRYEQLLQQQLQQAQAKKPRLGDALIAAGAAMAANRDPRVGLASILAQGIGAGSQSYQAAKEQQQKDINAAMMAQMSLERMRQQDKEKKAGAMMELMRMDSGQLQTLATTLEANARAKYEAAAQERNSQRRMQYENSAREDEQAFRMAQQAAEIKFKTEEGAKDRATQLKAASMRFAPTGSKDSVGATIDDYQNYAGMLQKEIDSLYKVLETTRRQDAPPIQNRIKELTSQKTSVLNMMQSAMAPRLGIPVLPRIPQIGQQK